MSRIIKSLSHKGVFQSRDRKGAGQEWLEKPLPYGRGSDRNRPYGTDSKNKIPWIVMSIVFAVPRSAFACAVCTGRSDDTVAQGINAAVFTLLLVLLVVMGALVSFLTYLIHRAVNHPLAQPGVLKREV